MRKLQTFWRHFSVLQEVHVWYLKMDFGWTVTPSSQWPKLSSGLQLGVCGEAGCQVVVLLKGVVSVPAVPVRHGRAAVALFGLVLLLDAGVLLRGVAGQVHGDVGGAEPLQNHRVELVGELASHFHDLAGAAVVSQGPRHLLVGHGLSVALAPAPALRQLLLVLGDEVEDTAATVRPLDGVAHVGVIQGFM